MTNDTINKKTKDTLSSPAELITETVNISEEKLQSHKIKKNNVIKPSVPFFHSFTVSKGKKEKAPFKKNRV